ncbi:hypothetical protein ALC56_12151 [Trachymyrmex septentrionalis]|uniref:Uncharacterized protein n=1 Tax=Trachymyrmex septentrionalis TaxID=34720 RepID=A0A195EZY8_9HYME|nr:hypothetical protein ALC56_12151 [Trachymyrmex septentrionalis]
MGRGNFSCLWVASPKLYSFIHTLKLLPSLISHICRCIAVYCRQLNEKYEREKGGGRGSDLQVDRYYVHSFLFPAGRYAFHSHSTNFLSDREWEQDRCSCRFGTRKSGSMGSRTLRRGSTVAWDTPSRAFSCTLERDIMDNIVIILRHLNNQI